MLPSVSNGIINSPLIFPLAKILLSFLLTNFGRKILVIFVRSFISFFIKAISDFVNIKSELKNDFSDKNKY